MPQDPRTMPNFYGKIVPTGIKHREQGIQTDVILGADGKYIIDLQKDMQNHAPEDTPLLTLLENLGTESIDKPIVNWMDEYESVQWIDIGLDDWRRRKVVRTSGAANFAVGSSYGVAKPAGTPANAMAHTVDRDTVPEHLREGSQVGGHLRINTCKLFADGILAGQLDEETMTYNLSNAGNLDPFMDDFTATNGEDPDDLFSHDDSHNLFPIDNAGKIVLLFRQRTNMQGNGTTMIEKLRNRASVFGYTLATDGGMPGVEVWTCPATAEHFMHLAIENATLRISPLVESGGLAPNNHYDLSTVIHLTQIVAKIDMIYFDVNEGCVGLKVSLAPEDCNIDLRDHGVDQLANGNIRGLVGDPDAIGYQIDSTNARAARTGRFGFHADNQASQVGVHAAIHLSHGYNVLNADGMAAGTATADSGMFTDHTGSISRCMLVRSGYTPPEGVPEFDRLDTAENLIFHRETMHNLAQIFTMPKYGISGTAQATKFRFEGDFERTRAFHLEAYKKRQENAFLYGVEYQTVAASNDAAVAGQPVRALSGLFDYSKFPIRYLSMPFPNLANMAATDTIAGQALFRFMKILAETLTSFRSRDAAKTLTLLAGKDIIDDLSMFNAYYASAWNVSGNLMGGNVQIQQPSVMTFGLDVYSYKVGNTTLNFVHTPAFDLATRMPIPTWIYGVNGLNPRKMLLLLDTANMRKAVLRPDVILGNVQEADRDGYLEGMRGECSLKVRMPKNYAVIRLT